jgi:hypothetical protein
MENRTFTFVKNGSTGSGRGITPTDAQRDAAYARLEQGFPNKTKAVEYLLSLGWSISAICSCIAYESDTRGHRAGDPIRMQHVNHIKDRYVAAGNKYPPVQPMVPVVPSVEKPVEPPKPVAPVTELRKS